MTQVIFTPAEIIGFMVGIFVFMFTLLKGVTNQLYKHHEEKLKALAERDEQVLEETVKIRERLDAMNDRHIDRLHIVEIKVEKLESIVERRKLS